jgi:serine/threonine protein kinase
LNSREGLIVGTPSFMAPERLKGGPLRKPCDVYAFGMLIYEVCFTQFRLFWYDWILQLHTNANPLNLLVGYSEFMELVAIKGHRPERPDGDEAPQMKDDIWRLAERCWAATPSARPSIDDICDIMTPFVMSPKKGKTEKASAMEGEAAADAPAEPSAAAAELVAVATEETPAEPAKETEKAAAPAVAEPTAFPVSPAAHPRRNNKPKVGIKEGDAIIL